MKLKDSFVTHDIDDTQFLIPLSQGGFSGFLRSNATAAFIINCLKKDTTEEKITNALLQEYDANRETVSADVRRVLDELRSIGALEKE